MIKIGRWRRVGSPSDCTGPDQFPRADPARVTGVLRRERWPIGPPLETHPHCRCEGILVQGPAARVFAVTRAATQASPSHPSHSVPVGHALGTRPGPIRVAGIGGKSGAAGHRQPAVCPLHPPHPARRRGCPGLLPPSPRAGRWAPNCINSDDARDVMHHLVCANRSRSRL